MADPETLRGIVDNRYVLVTLQESIDAQSPFFEYVAPFAGHEDAVHHRRILRGPKSVYFRCEYNSPPVRIFGSAIKSNGDSDSNSVSRLGTARSAGAS